ncbi:hypothetical protein M9458_019160, partial [Cirrhinus mrigala]
LHRTASGGEREPHGGGRQPAPLQPALPDVPDVRPAHRTPQHRQDDLLEQIRREDAL